MKTAHSQPVALRLLAAVILLDVAFGLGPLSHDEAAQMLDGTWAGRKLSGYRNLVAADRAAVIDVVLRRRPS